MKHSTCHCGNGTSAPRQSVMIINAKQPAYLYRSKWHVDVLSVALEGFHMFLTFWDLRLCSGHEYNAVALETSKPRLFDILERLDEKERR